MYKNIKYFQGLEKFWINISEAKKKWKSQEKIFAEKIKIAIENLSRASYWRQQWSKNYLLLNQITVSWINHVCWKNIRETTNSSSKARNTFRIERNKKKGKEKKNVIVCVCVFVGNYVERKRKIFPITFSEIMVSHHGSNNVVCNAWWLIFRCQTDVLTEVFTFFIDCSCLSLQIIPSYNTSCAQMHHNVN